jgi:hypothetical protein
MKSITRIFLSVLTAIILFLIIFFIEGIITAPQPANIDGQSAASLMIVPVIILIIVLIPVVTVLFKIRKK